MNLGHYKFNQICAYIHYSTVLIITVLNIRLVKINMSSLARMNINPIRNDRQAERIEKVQHERNLGLLLIWSNYINIVQ